MRVADFIARADVSADEYATAVKQIAGFGVVIHAENVAQWWIQHTEGLQGDELLKMYERCIPPFEVSVVEYRGVWDMEIAVVVTREVEDAGYLIHAHLWASDLQKKIAFIPAGVEFHIDHAGLIDGERMFFHRPYGGEEGPETDAARKELCTGLSIALLTFRFMNARGIRIVDKYPSRHEQRLAIKKGKAAPVTFKVLEIGPITGKMETEGRIDEVGMQKAFHLCRGHFADYTKGAGLFGKYNVEVFVPDHVKGRKERGIVVKDYSVSP